MAWTPEKTREYKRQWMANRRKSYFAGKFCVRCGSFDELEIDHIDRSTKVTNSIWSWSLVRQAFELAKCQILCGICHDIKTAEDFGWRKGVHGAQNTYVRGCRCEICVSDHNQRTREWRAKTGYSGTTSRQRAALKKQQMESQQ